MLKEALAAFAKLAQDAGGARTLTVPNGRDMHTFLDAGGNVVKVDLPPQTRQHVAGDLPSLARCVRRLATADAPASVWCSAAGVVALLDDGDRRDRVTYPLTYTPQFRQLLDWAQKPAYLEQAALVRLLQNLFRRSVANTTLVQAFSRIRVRSGNDGEAIVEHGRASVGRALEASVEGHKAPLPEEILFRESVFAGDALGIICEVRCVVDIDANAAKIAITPFADLMAEVIDSAEGDIEAAVMAQLGDAPNVHVYRGVP